MVKCLKLIIFISNLKKKKNTKTNRHELQHLSTLQ